MQVSAGFVTLVLSGATRQEMWKGLPLDIEAIAKILNGHASSDLHSPSVQGGETPYYPQGNRATQMASI